MILAFAPSRGEETLQQNNDNVRMHNLHKSAQSLLPIAVRASRLKAETSGVLYWEFLKPDHVLDLQNGTSRVFRGVGMSLGSVLPK